MSVSQYVYDGTNWVDLAGGGTPPPPDVQNLTASGTWVKNGDDADIYLFIVEIVGAASSGTSGGFVGRGGGFAMRTYAPGELGSTETVTIGAGGTWNGGSGSSGGDTTFKDFTVAGALVTGSGGRYATDPQATGGAGFYGATTNSGSSEFGGGAGSNSSPVTGGLGGTKAGASMLKAGNGANWSTGSGGEAPGGGGATSSARATGASGQVRVTTIYK